MTGRLRVGDRVRVAFDATIVDTDETPLPYKIESTEGLRQWVTADQVEYIPDPEPAWQPGDVIRYTVIRYTAGALKVAALFTTDADWIDEDRDRISAQYISEAWQAGDVEIVHCAAGAA